MTDNNEYTLSNLVDPLILEIFLFKNNYKDRLLISELKEKAHVVKVPGMEVNSFFVQVEDMIDVLHSKFEKDIIEFVSTPEESLSKSVTSIYFIDSMLQTFDKMKYFKINVSDSPVYSRKLNDVINFDFRVIHSKIDFTSFCTPDSLGIFCRLFKEVGLFKTDPYDKCPYFESMYSEIHMRLANHQATLTEEDEDFHYINDLFIIFGAKLEKDNPTLLVVIEP